MTKSAGLPYLEASGTSYEIGFQHGSTFRVQCKELLKLHTTVLCNDTVLSKDDLLRVTNKYIPFVEDWDHDIYEEIRGIADGAEISLSEKFLLEIPFAGANMLGRGALGDKSTSPPGCTDAAATGRAAANNEVFVGQTCDWYKTYRDYWIVQKSKFKNGPQILAAVPIGQIHGRIGLNSQGIGLCYNLLSSADWKFGVPASLIGWKILRQERIGDAIRAVANAERASSYGYTIGHKSGEVYYVETSADEFDVLYPDDGILTHANSYLSQRLKSRELLGYPETYDSIVRASRMANLLREKYGKITLDTMKAAWTDHLNYPRSICRHYDQGVSEWKQIVANVNVIIQFKEMKLHVLNGNPCEAKFTEYSL